MAKTAILRCRAVLFAWLILLAAAGPAGAGFHLPWQRPDNPPLCEPERDRGYFRPEYGELVQRLEPEKMDWLVSNFPVLGWQGMDPRLYIPKPVPGVTGKEGFRYDPIRRHLQLEALFHFGPQGGNGTLIEDAVWLDKSRLLTVNRGSDNLSIIEVDMPDVIGTLEAHYGIAAFEVNPRAGELYLLERGAHGMLVFALAHPETPPDTMHLGFAPGAVIKFPGSPNLFFTDEDGPRLVRIDLSGQHDMSVVNIDLKPPLWAAGHDEGHAIVLVSRVDGQVRLVDTRSFSLRPDRPSIGKPVVAVDTDADSARLILTVADGCRESEIWSLSQDDGSFTLVRRAALGARVRGLAAASGAGGIYAVAGGTLFRFGNGTVDRVRLGGYLRSVALGGEMVYVSGGLDDIYAVDRGLEQDQQHTRVEMGPGPLLFRDDKLYAVNCLSNSITVLDADNMEEDVSVLVGVLLGRMYYQDRRIVVNNLFRRNVMVLDPENYRIEEIIQAGGSLHFDPEARAYAVFDDSGATRLQSPPSAVTVNAHTVLPDGVRLFARSRHEDLYVVADQNRTVSKVNLSSSYNRGTIPLPFQARGISAVKDEFFIASERELFSFSLGDNVGLDRVWSVRPSRLAMPWVAADGFSPGRGSLLKQLRQGQLVDVFTARGDIAVIRNDPDTTRAWVAAGGELYVFDAKSLQTLASFNLRYNIIDLLLAPGALNAYAVATDQVIAIDRKSLLRYDDIPSGGQLVYGRGDDLFLLHPDDNRRLVVADGQRGDVFQELDIPLVPSDAAGDRESLFLLGATQGALAIYVNLIDSARLPRSSDRQVWDPQADRRAGYHR